MDVGNWTKPELHDSSGVRNTNANIDTYSYANADSDANDYPMHREMFADAEASSHSATSPCSAVAVRANRDSMWRPMSMKTNLASRAAFFNLRVLIALIFAQLASCTPPHSA
jgi:hypothetical protein